MRVSLCTKVSKDNLWCICGYDDLVDDDDDDVIKRPGSALWSLDFVAFEYSFEGEARDDKLNKWVYPLCPSPNYIITQLLIDNQIYVCMCVNINDDKANMT